MPPKNDIWQRYLRKFTKQGKLLDSDGPGLSVAEDACERYGRVKGSYGRNGQTDGQYA